MKSKARRKEYVLISRNINSNPEEKARYGKLKQRLIKQHIKKMKALVQRDNAELVSRERVMKATVSTERDWQKNAAATSEPAKKIAIEDMKRAISEYEQCERQEEAISNYIGCLVSLREKLKKSNGKPQEQNERARPPETAEDTNVPGTVQQLQEILKKKANLDEEMIKAYSKFIEDNKA
eukprot:TRINITY_DN2170_c0_g2_i3.p1 TRINITY_DN2170_c0_g2~~TRINITY_DN2170_c0_g2_i3.p1  ORF type:complete len:180 (-),score=57.24 TRINITY_DN2170_c0_g2_i3:66-605(-)